MDRRELLINTAQGTGYAMLLSAFGPTAFADSSKQCFEPWNASTKMVSWQKKKPPYRIALSNSYIGNSWRSEMVSIAKMYRERSDVKSLIKEFKVSSAGNKVNSQISQINQMVLSGFDAIVMDAASPTGLNSTIEKAVNNGVLVVSFDAVVTTNKAITVDEDQHEMGKRWAEFVVKQTGGKGNVLMVRGVAGTFVDKERYKGGKSVFDKHPGIKTTEVYGKWDQGTAQKVTSNALASGSGFDAVWSEGGDSGVVRAFQQAGHKVPPVGGEAENGFRKYAAKHQIPILSIGQSPALSAMAIKVALQMLQGHKMPQSIKAPLHPVTTADLKEGKNYFADLPGSFYTATSIPGCGLNFNPKAVSNTKT